MIIIGSNELVYGEKYRCILARADDKEEWLRYHQTLDSLLEAQKYHDAALNELEDEEDFYILEKTIETEEPY